MKWGQRSLIFPSTYSTPSSLQGLVHMAWQLGSSVCSACVPACVPGVCNWMSLSDQLVCTVAGTDFFLLCRQDMSKLQNQMDKHSLAASASSHSSRSAGREAVTVFIDVEVIQPSYIAQHPWFLALACENIAL